MRFLPGITIQKALLTCNTLQIYTCFITAFCHIPTKALYRSRWSHDSRHHHHHLCVNSMVAGQPLSDLYTGFCARSQGCQIGYYGDYFSFCCCVFFVWVGSLMASFVLFGWCFVCTAYRSTLISEVHATSISGYIRLPQIFYLPMVISGTRDLVLLERQLKLRNAK